MRPGIVALRDLSHRYMWDARAIAPFLAATGLVASDAPVWRGFGPPPVLVVVGPMWEAELISRARPWLAECEHVVVVRDGRDKEVLDDDVRGILEDEWRAALAPLRATTFDWIDDPAPCLRAIELAVELAKSAPPRRERVRPVTDRVLPSSEWIEWNKPQYGDGIDMVAASLAVRDGRAVMVDGEGRTIDLAEPRGPIVLDRFGDRTMGKPEAFKPRYRRFAQGEDPMHPVAWQGHRMAVYWSYVVDEVGFLTATDHDYPCGPAKKLWGYADNDPIQVALSPSADACAQRFEHDVLLMDRVPIGWHDAGAVEVAAFVGDPLRAVVYAMSEEFLERATDDLLDEDNREQAPAVVLAPSRKYAVSLRHRVVGIRGARGEATAEVVGGPNEGFAVFDAEHRLQRRRTGELLGGWFRHATVIADGALWREDLATGERTRIAAELPNHDSAFIAIPGTRNVLEIASARLRVI